MKKYLIVNSSGNVGKSFFSRELFYQNFESENKAIVELETSNSSSIKFPSVNVLKYQGDDFSELFTQIFMFEDVVIDLGASNAERFGEAIVKSRGMLDLIDMFFVPMIVDDKMEDDFHKTLEFLLSLGVPVKKIKIILNKVKVNAKEEFVDVKKITDKFGISLDYNIAINDYTDACKNLGKLRKLSGEMVADETDYRQLAAEAGMKGDTEKCTQNAKRHLTRETSISLNNQLEKVYNHIVGL